VARQVSRGRRANALSRGSRHSWEHCRAPTFADTDWRRIAELYDTLDRIAPSPLHALNRAVAEAYLHGPQAGLERLATVLPESVPARYPGWHAVIGELHFRLGRHSAAERAWRQALRFTTARAERNAREVGRE
jgi:RNA polymerase sigma-70 factor (ECF subfamily)